MNKTAADAISTCLAVTFFCCMCWHYMTGSIHAERLFTFYSYLCSIVAVLAAFAKPDGKKKSSLKRWGHGSITVMAIVYSVSCGWILLGSALTLGLLCSIARAMRNDQILAENGGEK